MMNKGSATIISGVGSSSLGAALATEICQRNLAEFVVAVDKRIDRSLNGVAGIHGVEIDLDPLCGHASYYKLAEEIDAKINALQTDLGFAGFGTAILSAGVYDSSTLANSQIASRAKVLGVNVCGKIEFLHSILNRNQLSGFDSATMMTLIDIGSSHGIDLTAGRSLYAASKAFGLNLCVTLSKGKEIGRVIHFAPGPMDTHMLHRNHWVVKECGSPQFFDDIFRANSSRYREIFIECDRAAFEDSAAAYPHELSALADCFACYTKRRTEIRQNGLLTAGEVAKFLSRIVQKESDSPSGIYAIASANGTARMTYREFPSGSSPV